MSDTMYTYMESPVGDIFLAREEAGLTQIVFQDGPQAVVPREEWTRDAGPFSAAVEQLAAYFDGALRDFDLPVAPRGTPFQQLVWEALRAIPLGETVAYQDIARTIGRPTACRAVGAANGRNPLSIVVPCHRVIGRDGRLTGYAGGIPIKEALLEHERRHFGVHRGQMSLV